jgi:uncharacterized protein (DUF1778 family)
MTDTPKRTDGRGQWTIKHTDVGPEFQQLVRVAAERQGQTVGSFVVETLRERAQAIIKGTPEGTPLRTAPARLEDVADALLAAVDKRMADMEERLAERLVPREVPRSVEEVPHAGVPASVDDREARRLRVALRRGWVGAGRR